MGNLKLRGISILLGLGLAGMAGTAQAAPCMEVVLTGVQGGPPVFQGQAGAGTLVRYGTEENKCSDVLLQFDAGRGTTQQLSKIGVPVGKLNAVFFTHVHSDHSEGLMDMMQLRWHFNSGGPKIDMVCSDDITAPKGHIMSCRSYGANLGAALIASGEMAQRLAENPKRLPGGPSELLNIMTFMGSDDAQTVWEKGDVKVTAVKSRHVPGHASYRVDTPAGSVVIGGDAGNDTPAPPRNASTSAQVEALAQGADVVVHSVIHPIMGPDGESGFPPPIYFRQSTATDLGGLSQRAGVKHLMLTHHIPPLGASKQGPYPVKKGGLSADDYIQAVRESGYDGNIVIGPDLTKLRLVAE
ncbi:Ribonuclease BN [Shimia sp. SK013]|uniref:MBL fold metallo-hydrolase n=1 Tax=Shimia sp. SK013 TaxID=1389006 RepID=UPI0006CDBDA8|nr:hypothetical protein [Shimia sp. SK013]KPA21960.1 Ribonuclease BN [Shimia sp. SK013]